MKSMLKENRVIIASIFLPIMVILLFWLATVFPRLFVKPPQYDVLFTAGGNYYNKPRLVFDIVQGKLIANLTCDNICDVSASPNQVSLYLFEQKTKTIRKIKINFPTISPNQSLNIVVPQFKNVTIRTSKYSPDGYVYREKSNMNNWIGDLFFQGSSNAAIITKQGNAIVVAPSASDFNNVKFIGWVMPQ